VAEIDGRLNGDGVEIRHIFALADKAAYSREQLTTEDFQQWQTVVRQQLKQMEEL